MFPAAHTGSRLDIIMIAVTINITHAETSETSVTFSNYHFNSNYLGEILTGPGCSACPGCSVRPGPVDGSAAYSELGLQTMRCIGCT
jgi:hypothetical protein